MAPVNLLESVPPKVSSPLVEVKLVVGSKETATKFEVIIPCENKLSVTIPEKWLAYSQCMNSSKSHQ